jgi:predicted metal-dependent phosphoesterase TrpH
MSIVDLHMHSNCSDGTVSPEELVSYAHRAGLQVISLTDHDSIIGIDAAIEAGKGLGVRVIPGVEMNTDYGEREVHILGYFVDYHNTQFQEVLESQRSGRKERNRQIVERLQNLGLDITLDDISVDLTDNTSPGRPHVARALKRKGYVESVQEAFEKYLNRGGPAYVPRRRFTPAEAIKAVLEAQGVPVLAHPGYLGGNGVIPELIKAGLMGLEVYYPDHDEFITQQLYQLTQQRDLIATGGSDWHGPSPDRPVTLGNLEVPFEVVENLERAWDRVRHGENVNVKA